MRIGFTGTSRGMTAAQMSAVSSWLPVRYGVVHHGDCLGADAEFHFIARSIGFTVEIHPPSDDRARAFCAGDLVHPARRYLDRNHDIVAAADVLLAAPRSVIHPVCRHGTCATVRHARAVGVPVVVFLPSGVQEGQ